MLHQKYQNMTTYTWKWNIIGFIEQKNFYIMPCDGILDHSTGLLFTPKFKTNKSNRMYIWIYYSALKS